MTDDEIASIRSQLQSLFNSHQIAFTVVIIDRMSRYGHHGEIEPFATELFNFWGVGDAQSNLGIMLLVAKDNRQMRIEIGDGIDPALDRDLGRIIEQVILPEFRRDRYGTGVEAGVSNIISTLKASPHEGAGRLFPSIGAGLERLWRVVGTGLILPILLVLGVVALIRRTRRFVRGPKAKLCPRDGAMMELLDETEDDAYIEAGKRVEEKLGSVDYDIYLCGTCGHVVMQGHPSWLTRYSACSSCGHHTVEGDITTTRGATHDEAGEEVVDFHCHNCGEHRVVHRSIPKNTPSEDRQHLKGEDYDYPIERRRALSLGMSGGGTRFFGRGRSSGSGKSGRW